MLREQKGFTLIELVICISIIGIFAAITIPNYIRATREKEVDRAAKQLASDFQDMRQRSADNGDTFTLVINNDNYVIQEDGGNVGASVKFNADLVQFTAKTLTFDANNLSNNVKSSIVVSSVGNDYKRYIYIARATGRVRVSADATTQDGE